MNFSFVALFLKKIPLKIRGFFVTSVVNRPDLCFMPGG